jgi:hypothetical protein
MRLPAKYLSEHKSLVWATLDGLRPSRAFQAMVDLGASQLHSSSPTGRRASMLTDR